jgi:hypothetical protein
VCTRACAIQCACACSCACAIVCAYACVCACVCDGVYVWVCRGEKVSDIARERERARERENSARDSAERESLDALLNGGSRAEVGAWSM